MSLASEWAERYRAAKAAAADVNSERPSAAPTDVRIGKGWLRGSVDEYGCPQITYKSDHSDVALGGSLNVASYRHDLVRFAKWVIETFDDPPSEQSNNSQKENPQ